MKRSLEIIIASVIVVMLFGIIHNQLTIRISPYFFTMILPRHPWADSDNLTLLALVWGITGAWWLGLIGGLILAFFARIGNEPRIEASNLVIPALIAIIMNMVLELFLALLIFPLYTVDHYFESDVLYLKRDFLLTVAALQDMFYVAGAMTIVALSIWIIIKRFKMRQHEKKKNLVDPWA